MILLKIGLYVFFLLYNLVLRYSFCMYQVSSAQLRDDLLSLLVAGHETTGSVLTWTLYLLSKVPLIFSRLYWDIEFCFILFSILYLKPTSFTCSVKLSKCSPFTFYSLKFLFSCSFSHNESTILSAYNTNLCLYTWTNILLTSKGSWVTLIWLSLWSKWVSTSSCLNK